MGSPMHTRQVMDVLADCLGAALPEATTTPFGVSLEPAWGLYAAGQQVSAPGLDECSPRLECEVAAVGRRTDHDGVWYLLRCLDRHGGHALVREDDLRPAAAARETSDALHGGRARPFRAQAVTWSSAVMRAPAARHAGARR
jgi:hypothetical protein